MLAYAGLRPGEALGLRWHDVGERTILVERSVAFGQLKSTKTERKTRTVELLKPARRRRSTPGSASRDARSRDRSPIFPSPDGSPWSLDRVNNWRKRTFADAVQGAGLSPMRPYDLRHSWVSLLIAEGATVVEVAPTRAGHSPTMSLNTYAHLFDEHDRTQTSRAADRIARPDTVRRSRRVRFVSASNRRNRGQRRKSLQNRYGRSRTRTWDLFLIREAPLTD